MKGLRRFTAWTLVGVSGVFGLVGCTSEATDPPELAAVQELWDESPTTREAVCNANPDSWGLGRSDYLLLADRVQEATDGEFLEQDLLAVSLWFLSSYSIPGSSLTLNRGFYRTKFEFNVDYDSLVDASTGEGKRIPLSDGIVKITEGAPDFLGWVEPMEESPCPWVPQPTSD